jgi:ribosomal protein L11
MEFCKQFNNISCVYEDNLILNILVFQYEDKTFNIFLKGILSTHLLKESLFLKYEDDNFYYKTNFIDLEKLYKISILKNLELNSDLKSVFKMILSTSSISLQLKLNK